MASATHSRRISRTLVIFAIVLALPLLIAPLLLLCIPIFVIPSTTTDIDQYAETRSIWPTELVSHFPTEIPADALDVRFSAFPGFLQGGAHIQLSYRLPEDQIEQLLDNFNNQAKARYKGGRCLDYANEDRKNKLPIAQYVTGTSKETEFPSDFIVIVLGAKAYCEFNNEPNWNHGNTHGLAISQTKHQAVFWAEQW